MANVCIMELMWLSYGIFFDQYSSHSLEEGSLLCLCLSSS